jgi:hypothetical protein
MNLTRTLTLFTAAILWLSATTGRAENPQGGLDVLFVGNSYTAGNNLIGMIKQLARAGGNKPMTHGGAIFGGCTLKKHWEEKGAAKKIASKKWDVVVLQEQSMMPVVNPKVMHAYARKLHGEVKEAGGRTVFYLTWARQHKPEMQDGLNKAYLSIAKELGAEVAPVGMAWKKALTADPKRRLHAKDKSHPNRTGTYLTACVFYGTIYGKSPVGLPGKIGGLSDAAARPLQEIAWETVQGLKRE